MGSVRCVGFAFGECGVWGSGVKDLVSWPRGNVLQRGWWNSVVTCEIVVGSTLIGDQRATSQVVS